MAESKKNRAIAAELIAKASRDSAFRQRFLADPKAVLIAAGAEIAADVEVRALESTEKLRYIVLPALPGDGAELTDAQLAAIAGGGSSVTNTTQTAEAQTTTVQTAEVATTVDVAGEVAAAGVTDAVAACVVVAT